MPTYSFAYEAKGAAGAIQSAPSGWPSEWAYPADGISKPWPPGWALGGGIACTYIGSVKAKTVGMPQWTAANLASAWAATMAVAPANSGAQTWQISKYLGLLAGSVTVYLFQLSCKFVTAGLTDIYNKFSLAITTFTSNDPVYKKLAENRLRIRDASAWDGSTNTYYNTSASDSLGIISPSDTDHQVNVHYVDIDSAYIGDTLQCTIMFEGDTDAPAWSPGGRSVALGRQYFSWNGSALAWPVLHCANVG